MTLITKTCPLGVTVPEVHGTARACAMQWSSAPAAHLVVQFMEWALFIRGQGTFKVNRPAKFSEEQEVGDYGRTSRDSGRPTVWLEKENSKTS